MILYATKILSEALLIHFINNLIVIKAKQKLKIIPIIISLLKKKPFSINKLMLSNVVAASITGIDNKREYLDASTRLKPIYNPAVITIPDLLVPGIIASV